MPLFGKKKAVEVDLSRLPRHIAIIMDGNGRWAKRRGLPRKMGHAAGAETFRAIGTYCRELGIEYLTVYAFSTENWKRPADEVSAIMELLRKYLGEALEEMEKEKVRLCFFGDLTPLTPELRQLCQDVQQRSAVYQGCQVNLCLNYGGRDEILRAAKTFAQSCQAGEREAGALDEALFSSLMWTAGVPDPELVIRTSGELRLSNFLLWQSAYSEFYITDVNWPDFDRQELLKAIAAYQSRQRRFGGI